jgi:hypothetical protein
VETVCPPAEPESKHAPRVSVEGGASALSGIDAHAGDWLPIATQALHAARATISARGARDPVVLRRVVAAMTEVIVATTGVLDALDSQVDRLGDYPDAHADLHAARGQLASAVLLLAPVLDDLTDARATD